MLPEDWKHEIEDAANKASARAADAQNNQTAINRKISADVEVMADELKTHHAKQESGETKKTRRENLTIVALCVAAAGSIALAVVAILQWCTLEKTDQTLRDTLSANKIEQRAFIFRNGYSLVPRTENDAIARWGIVPILENSGSLPTIFYIYTDYADGKVEFGKPIECPADFKAISQVITNGYRRVLGPRETTSEETGAIRVLTVEEVIHTREFFVYGLVVYTDGFTTERRQTRFCNGIILNGNPHQFGLAYSAVPARTGNCIDDECLKQDHER
jgi:hypothetical protein